MLIYGVDNHLFKIIIVPVKRSVHFFNAKCNEVR